MRPCSSCVYVCELSGKQTTLQRDAGDKGGGICLCVRVCLSECVSPGRWDGVQWEDTLVHAGIRERLPNTKAGWEEEGW